MNSFPQAATLNNKGAYHLLHGEYGQAITLFRSSILSTKKNMKNVGHLTSKHASTSRHASSSYLRLDFFDLDCQSQRNIEVPNTCNQEDTSFVSKSIVIINQNDPQDTDAHHVAMAAVGSVYNLAIANHLCGLQNRSMKQLQRALEHYEMCYKLQMQGSLIANPTLVLSILNNVGVIYKDLNHQEKSAMFFRQLLSTMTLLKESGGQTDPRWNGFWSNVIDLVLELPCSASAA